MKLKIFLLTAVVALAAAQFARAADVLVGRLLPPVLRLPAVRSVLCVSALLRSGPGLLWLPLSRVPAVHVWIQRVLWNWLPRLLWSAGLLWRVLLVSR